VAHAPAGRTSPAAGALRHGKVLSPWRLSFARRRPPADAMAPVKSPNTLRELVAFVALPPSSNGSSRCGSAMITHSRDDDPFKTGGDLAARQAFVAASLAALEKTARRCRSARRSDASRLRRSSPGASGMAAQAS
jgi:hypothetical protein